MSTKLARFGLVALIGGVVLAFNSLYIVNQVEQALVLQFGEAKGVQQEPGLKVKLPFVQNVLFFDNRLLDFNAEPKEVIDSDNRPIIIDAFLRYRVTDPLKYYQSVQNESGLALRLNDILESSLRKVVGRGPYTKLLTAERSEIMNAILRDVSDQVSGKQSGSETSDPLVKGGFGIHVVDVRIKRADLSERVSKDVYKRMRSERERIAKELRAKGEERAQVVRSTAERERAEIISESRKKAEIIRGEADAIAAKTYADAFQRDKEFYDFYRSLQAYRQVLKGKDTTMVLSPDSDFLKYLDNMNTQ